MKLTKLIYIADGFHLALNDKELINERPQAWKYGPVVFSVYHSYKKYGGESIPQLSSQPSLDESTIELLDKVWEKFGAIDSIKLSEWSHQLNSPWYEAWHYQPSSSAIIPIRELNRDLTKAYFSKFLKKTD